MKKTERRAAAVILAVAVLAVSLGIAGAGLAETTHDAIYSASNPVTDVAARVRPAIVQIHAMIETWSRETGKGEAEIGYGTGVYIDGRGYVVTNYHVVSGADYIRVETVSGEMLETEAVLSDDSVDLTVIKLERPLDGVQPVELGDSNALALGELVIAIGNPVASGRAYPGTVTAGIVSGLNVENGSDINFSRAIGMIQTDAALGIGSSGGALLNARGELVGLTTLGLDENLAEVYEGIGFAIPSALIKKVTGDLMDYGVVRRPRMGVMVVDLEGPEKALKDYPPCGPAITEIEADGPADRAGLRLYDIITAVDGERTHNFIELSAILDELNAGDTVRVSVYRCYDPETGYMIDSPEYMDFDVTLEIMG